MPVYIFRQAFCCGSFPAGARIFKRTGPERELFVKQQDLLKTDVAGMCLVPGVILTARGIKGARGREGVFYGNFRSNAVPDVCLGMGVGEAEGAAPIVIRGWQI